MISDLKLSTATKYLAGIFALTLFVCTSCQHGEEPVNDNNSPASSTSEPSEIKDDRAAASTAYHRAIEQIDVIEKQHRAVFDGGKVPLHYLQWNLGSIENAVIFLHGTYNTAYEFVPCVNSLMASGYQIVSVDWYGHGKTAVPAQDATVDDLARDIHALLNSLGIKKAVLVGHSRGGMIATAYYGQFPDHTAGLVLIDGGSTCNKYFFDSLGESELRSWMLEWFDEKTQLPMAPTFASQEELFAAKWNRFGQPDDLTPLLGTITQSIQRDDGRWTEWRPAIQKWLETGYS